MVNVLPLEKQANVLAHLVEGSSARSTERLTGVHRNTILRTLRKVGDACAQLHDERMTGLQCQEIQVDEIWTYVGKKDRHIRKDDDKSKVGSFWCWIALDPESKLIPSYLVGKRGAKEASEFMADLEARLELRIQLSSDMFAAYGKAVRESFGAMGVDYGQIVKFYSPEAHGKGRYSPPKVTKTERSSRYGEPEHARICTSHVERQNLTLRMQNRRFTRLTNAFSKKPENLKAAIDLHMAYYNFVRPHSTVKATPAQAAGVIDTPMSMLDLVELAA